MQEGLQNTRAWGLIDGLPWVRRDWTSLCDFRQLGRRDSSRAHCASLHFHYSYLLPQFLCLISIQSCGSVCSGGHSQRIWTKESTWNANSNKNWVLSKACDVTWPEKCKQTSADSPISSVPFVLNIYKNEIYEYFFLNTIFFVDLYRIVKCYYIRWWSLWMLPPVLTVCILFAGNRQQHIRTQIFLRTVSMGIVC